MLIVSGVIYIIEFKQGEDYTKSATDQVLDYALDLKNFHFESRDKHIIPVLCTVNACEHKNNLEFYEDNIATPLLCNKDTLSAELNVLANKFIFSEIDDEAWVNSPYMPTPTIIEAAQALYNNHNVKDISRSDASAANLSVTAAAIDRIIRDSKDNKKKSICFITGVPGAGKTLAGLNIACTRHKFEEEEHAVFLSGNGPLVDVLQEALARDDVKRNQIRKADAVRKSKSFIQIIHHFRDDALSTEKAPIERVAIFDEAQRAWDKNQTAKFMQTKKGVAGFSMSEPEFLISVMDRHEDWTVIVCLIGGGQEINVGEAGIVEWFSALKHKFSDWDVYLSKNITDSEYCKSGLLLNEIDGINYKFIDGLHLGVSLRSFRSEKLALFVKNLLDMQKDSAKEVYKLLNNDYPIRITRDINIARNWVNNMARGTERCGLTASSGGRRLRTEGIWVQSKVDPVSWFLGGKDDVRSSYYLEETATEFDIQGLELDYTIVAWDADFRFEGGKFSHYNFSGTKWQNINNAADQGYLKNAYRVLLTRARQGFVIYIPKGDDNDKTRAKSFYNGTYKYLRNLGIETLDDNEIDLNTADPFNIIKPAKENAKLKNVGPSREIGNSFLDICPFGKKVGKIANEELRTILESGIVEEYIISSLLREDYSKQTLGCNMPALKKIENLSLAKKASVDHNGRSRYYKDPLTIRGEHYVLTSQWYDNSKEKLLAFIKRLRSC